MADENYDIVKNTFFPFKSFLEKKKRGVTNWKYKFSKNILQEIIYKKLITKHYGNVANR